MSDTRRHVQPGWGPENPRWRSRWEEELGLITKKSQARDRPSCAAGTGRGQRFSKNSRNSRHNLLAKIDALRTKEVAACP